ncbi:MFS transporter [Photobacterium rosenbergii]|uniref:MFS transporter n=1 Tax=Photobacterium rosenbergii TaxID=294936 RepID=A0ABU3ZDM5_9GAMM|nr:MFS transporter [Photobacterium rosenbergii]MDV5168207.1 MFS transporter [Photobacterium rosenbergii]
MNNETGIEYWKKLIVVLCFGWVAIWIYRTVLTPIYPEIQAALGGISDTEIGFIATFYYGAYCSGQVPASLAVEKFGQKLTLLCGFGLFTVGTLVIGSASGISMVYTGSLFSGLGCATFFCSAYSLSGENVPENRRAFASAIVNSGAAIGMGIGLIGSSVLVKSMNLAWNYVLYFSAAVIFIMFIVFALMIKPRENEPVRVKEAHAPTPVPEGGGSNLLSLELVTVYFLYFCTCYGYYMIVTWLPSYLQTERGFEGAAIGGASALVAMVAVPGALFFSSLADKFKAHTVKLVIALEVMAALMLTFTVLASNTSVLMISLVVYGFLGKMALDPILIAFVTERAPKARMARALALFNLSGMSSSIVAPPLTGFISDITGSKAIGFYLSAGLLVSGAIIFTLVYLRGSTKATVQAA